MQLNLYANNNLTNWKYTIGLATIGNLFDGLNKSLSWWTLCSKQINQIFWKHNPNSRLLINFNFFVRNFVQKLYILFRFLNILFSFCVFRWKRDKNTIWLMRTLIFSRWISLFLRMLNCFVLLRTQFCQISAIDSYPLFVCGIVIDRSTCVLNELLHNNSIGKYVLGISLTYRKCFGRISTCEQKRSLLNYLIVRCDCC